MSTEGRLAELRAKTDSELARYVTSELANGIRFAAEPNHESYRRAETACTEAARLLPVIYGLTEPRRRQLESKLAQLRQMLRPLPALTQTAR